MHTAPEQPQISEYLYWNERTYGGSFTVTRKEIAKLLGVLAVAIPVVFPLPAVPVLMRYVFKRPITVRYDRSKQNV